MFMKSIVAQQLLQKVQRDYEAIAEEFAASREALWQELYRFLDFVKDGDRILDIGCGNGRLMNLFADRQMEYTGIDNAKHFIEIARERCREQYFKCKILFGDILNLPCNDAEFDAAACIAVLHHIPGEELQLKALKEIRRVLKPQGVLFLTVWNLFQPRYLPYVLKYNIKKFFSQSNITWNDAFIPFRGKVLRYVHAFALHELEVLIKKAGFDIIDSYYVKDGKRKHKWNGSNIIIIAKKYH